MYDISFSACCPNIFVDIAPVELESFALMIQLCIMKRKKKLIGKMFVVYV